MTLTQFEEQALTVRVGQLDEAISGYQRSTDPGAPVHLQRLGSEREAIRATLSGTGTPRQARVTSSTIYSLSDPNVYAFEKRFGIETPFGTGPSRFDGQQVEGPPAAAQGPTTGDYRYDVGSTFVPQAAPSNGEGLPWLLIAALVAGGVLLFRR